MLKRRVVTKSGSSLHYCCSTVAMDFCHPLLYSCEILMMDSRLVAIPRSRIKSIPAALNARAKLPTNPSRANPRAYSLYAGTTWNCNHKSCRSFQHTLTPICRTQRSARLHPTAHRGKSLMRSRPASQMPFTTWKPTSQI